MSGVNLINPKFIKLLKKVLPVIGIILFIYIINDIGPSKVVSALLGISPWIIGLIIALGFIRILLNNYIWQIILKRQKIKIRFFQSLKINLVGRFYGFSTPGQLGRYTKLVYLKEKTNEPLGKLFINLNIGYILNAFAFYVLLLIASFLIAERFPYIFIGVLLYVSIIVTFYLCFAKRERGEKVLKILIKYLVPKRLKDTLTKFTETFYDDFPKIRELILPFLLNVYLQILIYFQLYIIAMSLGIKVPFYIIFVFFSIAGIVAAFPTSVIGGLGIREVTLWFLFSPFGIELDRIIALSLANYILAGLLPASYGLVLAVIDARNKKQRLLLKSPISLKKLSLIKDIVLTPIWKK